MLGIRIFGSESTGGNEQRWTFVTVRRDGATEVYVTNKALATLADLRRAHNHYPLINAEGGTENCTWVRLAALLANGDRMTTEMLYTRLKERNITVSKGPTSRTSLLKAARTLGDIDVRSIDSKYTKLSENDMLQVKELCSWRVHTRRNRIACAPDRRILRRSLVSLHGLAGGASTWRRRPLYRRRCYGEGQRLAQGSINHIRNFSHLEEHLFV